MASLKPLHLRVIITLCLALFSLVRILSLPHCLAQPAQPRIRVDWILVLDTSESMIGHGKGAKDIFDKVKGSIKKFIDRAEPGDTITLYRFDQIVEKVGGSTRSITNQEDKENLKKSIDSIPARGQRTHTGEAMREALKTSADLKKLPDASQRAVMIVLFTDGQEDVADMKNPFHLSDLSITQRESEPHSYLVWLTGEEPNQEIKDALAKLNGHIISAPNEAAIDDVINKIPKVPQPKQNAQPSVEISLSMDPDTVDFGQVETGEQTDAKTVYCRSSGPIRAQLSVDNVDSSGITLVEPEGAFDLIANETAEIKIRLAAASGIANGDRTLKLVLSSVTVPSSAKDTVDARLSLVTVPGWRKIANNVLKWLAIALAVGIVGIILLSLRKGQTPTEMWRGFTGRNYLEGELEIIRPRPAELENRFVALGTLQRDRVNLSELLPQGATTNSNAELVTVHKNDNKLVQLKTTQGVVRVNRIEIAVAELYNGDEIELGDARVRFNSLHERPSDNLE